MLNETCDLYVHLYISLSLYSAGVRFVAAYCRGRETHRRDQRSVSQLKSVISFQESAQCPTLNPETPVNSTLGEYNIIGSKKYTSFTQPLFYVHAADEAY